MRPFNVTVSFMALLCAVPVIGAIVAVDLIAPGVAEAQDCLPGDEFCLPPPPCYREPDNPDCNPECTCLSPDYPACDPFCAPGDLCDTDCANPCYDEFEGDICSDDPPPCDPTAAPPFTFVDDMDGSDDGQIFALGNRDPTQSCGTLTVDVTGYYSIFDTELSESCDDQLDETGYLTIRNTCNGDGWAVERNAEDRFLVYDSDNSPDCTSDAECGAGKTCRDADSHGRCCVPVEPVFMGTYLLVEGEPNTICINHWCPEWNAEIAAGRDFGFVVDSCDGVNSIHFKIGATAIACIDDTHLQPCSWGCEMGECLPDPCLTMSCASFCMDGTCLDDNPCASVTCEHGCVRGLCLQNRNARGPDLDDDGYSDVADCDDGNALVHPGRMEVCGNGVDDNCDGFIDERPCGDGTGGPDSGTGGPDSGTGADSGGGVGPGLEEGGCGCGTAPGDEPAGGAAIALLVLASLLRRRRRPGHGRQ